MGCMNSPTVEGEKNHNNLNTKNEKAEHSQEKNIMQELCEKKTAKIKGLCPDLAKRWSPRIFSNREVENEKLELFFKAASWAASSYNEQPWLFIVGSKSTSLSTYDNIFSCLVEFNQSWTRSAPVLFLVCSRSKYSQTGKANIDNLYDAGQSMAFFTLQATMMGLYLHQMGGFDKNLAKKIFEVPEDVDICAAVALGYIGNLENINESLRTQEETQRERKDLKEFVFSDWGKPAYK